MNDINSVSKTIYTHFYCLSSFVYDMNMKKETFYILSSCASLLFILSIAFIR